MTPTAADRSYVLAVTRRILGNEDLAADATQDTLLSAHRNRAQFHGRSAYRSWLHRIAVNAALSQLRVTRRQRLQSGAEVPDTVDPGASPETVVAARELLAAVLRAIEAIPPAQREVLGLSAAGHSETQIATALGISIANAKIRAHRARQQLLRSLGRK